MNTPSISKFHAALCAAVLALVSLSSPTHAQGSTVVAVARVPFPFEFGSHHFEAGRYTVCMQGDHVMTIQSATDSGAAITMWDIDMKPSERSEMGFRNYGGRLFLREVWTAGETVHLQSVESKAEKQARRSEVASIHAITPDVEIALLQVPH